MIYILSRNCFQTYISLRKHLVIVPCNVVIVFVCTKIKYNNNKPLFLSLDMSLTGDNQMSTAYSAEWRRRPLPLAEPTVTWTLRLSGLLRKIKLAT